MEWGLWVATQTPRTFFSQHARILLKQNEAAKTVGDMKEQVAATWYDTVRASGVSESEAKIILPSLIVYEVGISAEGSRSARERLPRPL